MTTTNRNRIIERIASIAKLQGGAGAFQGEINNAASLIQSLMDKYSISQQEIEMENLKNETKAIEEEFIQKPSTYWVHGLAQWHLVLAGLIARITHTKSYFGTLKKGGRAKFFGSENNVEVATVLFTEWVQIIMAMCDSAIDDHWQYLIKKYDYPGFLAKKKEMGLGREYSFMQEVVPQSERTTHFKSSWYTGCLHGIAAALNQQERSREEGVQTALVLYHENLDEKYKVFSLAVNMKDTKIKPPKVLSNIGYDQGYETGKKIRIGSKRVGN